MGRTFIVENAWSCTSCSAENRGRDMKCGKCGAPKAKDAPERLAGPNGTVVTDPELLRLAKQGANWVCEFCGSQVRDEHGKCRNCAARREEAVTRVMRSKPPQRPREEAAREFKQVLDEISNEVRDPKVVRPSPAAQAYMEAMGLPRAIPGGPSDSKRKPEPWRWRWWHTTAIVIAALIPLVGLPLWLFMPRELDAKVENTGWTYTASLRQRTLMHGSEWAPIRGDAFNKQCENRYYGDENCHPHDCRPHQVSYSCNCTSYECNCRTSCTSNRNGFSTCSESCSTCSRCSTCYRTEYDTCYDRCPVYRDWCSFDWYDWPIIATKTTRGTTQTVYWPELEARPGDQKLDRVESYAVTFRKGEKSWSYAPSSLGEYRYFNPGATWRVKVNRAGSIWPQLERSRP